MSQAHTTVNPISVGVVLVQAMRPHQWIKNLLVFAALLFTAQFTNPTLLWQTVLGFFALCFTASSVYLVNDILDRERDRHHPKKQHRPIASGRLPVPIAWLGAAAALALGLGLAFWLRIPFGVVVLVYALLSTLYTFYLKHIPLLDVVIIALGVPLRAVSGAVLIDVSISPWLIICTFFLALFLGFAKRRHELVSLGESAAS
ncbi:MAG: UbiA prenyltransferase family protein, partial [bacterium]|nr:UbiA prenyltransferase family protein [bacterium]